MPSQSNTLLKGSIPYLNQNVLRLDRAVLDFSKLTRYQQGSLFRLLVTVKMLMVTGLNPLSTGQSVQTENGDIVKSTVAS